MFLPLCGKTLDIHWLLGRGYRIAGSKIAIEQLFSELGVEPVINANDEVGRRYQDSYDLKLLASADVRGGLKGKCAAKKNLITRQGQLASGGHGRSAERYESETRNHGAEIASAVEPLFELREIRRNMLGTYRFRPKPP